MGKHGYRFIVGVIGYCIDAGSTTKVKQALTEAFNAISQRYPQITPVVAVEYNALANAALKEADRRGWEGIRFTELPSAPARVHCDAMVRIGGSETERAEAQLFKQRFASVEDAPPLYEYDIR